MFEFPAEKKTIEPSQKILMVSTTNTITNITNHQLLTIKTIKKMFSVVCFGHIPLGIIGFNKPPIEGDQLPDETHRVHFIFL